jgi:hypothetical protein
MTSVAVIRDFFRKAGNRLFALCDSAFLGPMKSMLRLMFAGVLFCAASAALAVEKVSISAQKKRADDTAQGQVKFAGNHARRVDKIAYTLTLENKTKAELADVSVEYVIFVDRQKLGEQKGEEHIERIRGAKNLAQPLGHDPQFVTSKKVALVTQNRAGNFVFADGGRIRAEDSVVGVWVKVIQNSEEIGEYINPPTIKARQRWDD